ncbi:DNA mismatch repair protein MutL [Aureimonas sp. SA4125]|uniref:DNA mismatch repair endonuclease MutL n=1 Tax=Aureimonas sp. SA4125 TaxID=2826993 RepID=UPI001CC81657|nr:DNA mismatch repair endonuclease MutL [Aureimonas sp. SA4125]BDA82832.1 DNA mismatch repair protein MutL [Aureimonas sp. SA4125]
MSIRQLSETVIDQIAAGEVVERPASVVKELVENALDAGARRIDIVTAGGGKSLLRITDDGHGIAAAELPLAVRRHCTSKLLDDLHAIETLGFRGEALPSIGSVARLSLRSRQDGSADAHEISVHAGKLDGPRPAALGRGTVVEVRDLFHAVPARLKFLKSEKAEAAAITDVIRRIAIAFPEVRFSLSGSDRSETVFEAASPIRRIGAVVGQDFAENSLEIDASREDIRLEGFAGLPSFSRGNAQFQYLYVNGRPVKDRLLLSALRGAYADVMARDRHPIAVLFLTIDPRAVDINVHPAKADVRFRDPGLVRGLIVGAIRETLWRAGLRGSTEGAAGLLGRFRPGGQPPAAASDGAEPPGGERGWDTSGVSWSARSPSKSSFAGFSQGAQAAYAPDQSPFRPLGATLEGHPADALLHAQPRLAEEWSFAGLPPAARTPDTLPAGGERADDTSARYPLGAARAQLHDAFILAETADGFVLVDQHAAHERLVYEALKSAIHARPLPAQMLLIPEIVDLPVEDADRLAEQAPEFERFGLVLERFGPGAVAIRAVPAILGKVDGPALVRDLADELADCETADRLLQKIDHVAATIACHGSVRAGRTLRQEEMNALLRQMESTPGAGTCNHGRPTFIELKLADIERLFGRR